MNFKTPALVAALVLTASTSFASVSDNNLVDDYLDAKSHVQALSAQLETMGINADANVEFNAPATYSQKLDAYKAKIDELQGQFDAVHNAS